MVSPKVDGEASASFDKWFAIDDLGETAVFYLYHGEGVVPTPLAEIEQRELFELITLLPVSSEYNCLSENIVSDEFKLMGSRGLFVYEWEDNKKLYRKVIDPKCPYNVDKYPDEVLSRIGRVHFFGEVYELMDSLSVHEDGYIVSSFCSK